MIRPLPAGGAGADRPAAAGGPARWRRCAEEAQRQGLSRQADEAKAASRRGGSRRVFWYAVTNPEPLAVDDRLWAEIEPLLVRGQRRRGPASPKRIPDRIALSGILYVARKGINWSQLPHELGYGSGMTCWSRLRQWERAGIWADVQPLLRRDLDDGDQIPWARLAPLTPPL